ncbi:hypothetical protein LEP1GSC188_5067 [Leptospira weilii serovar Topaz str. LT2116]|uniref:Uncharacterized protein n=1 Tax=Leptospira weilii serovar Topaz str. LT2116 TaxID=1088540 RepID=M3GY80_9LEPT|nr:hypothetical protein LEP1GSC188_5067 [Leptospira weilii serovar Topaz str. LT2116]
MLVHLFGKNGAVGKDHIEIRRKRTEIRKGFFFSLLIDSY